ncbi:MAG TPA: T9SS type A sorting domain-containing protein, partial [Ignavibacteriales bacterium]|nr:T9SS type A sorting domain-containing protein [Ignavibacteriales bacterium]
YYLKRMDGSDVIAPADVPKIYYEEISHERKWPLQGTIVSKNPITNTITISPDYTPRNLTIGASYNHPYIQWNASAFPNLAYYEIWKKKNGTWSLKTTTTNTNYTDSGELIVAPNVVVNYKVCAVNNSGQKTGFSNEVSISVGSMAKQNSDNAEQMENGEIPNALGAQNYPNPFNPTTVINYAIPQDSRVTLKVYNMLGQEVAALVDDFKTAGRYNVTFDASHLSTGMYIYRLTAGNNILVKKISFVK